MSQILEELKAAETGTPQEEAQEETASYVFDTEKIKEAELAEPTARNRALIPYTEYKIKVTPVDKETFNPYDKKCSTIIKRILKDEQPATETYLCKRLAKALGFGHAGANIQRAVSFAISELYQDPMSAGGILSFWIDEESAKDYHSYRAPSPRSITEIPAVEIANAIKEVVEEEFSLPKDNIATLAARKLGFSSAGTKITEMINIVIDMLAEKSVVTINNGAVSLNENG